MAVPTISRRWSQDIDSGPGKVAFSTVTNGQRVGLLAPSARDGVDIGPGLHGKVRIMGTQTPLFSRGNGGFLRRLEITHPQTPQASTLTSTS